MLTRIEKQINALVQQYPEKVAEALLRRPFWPRGVETRKRYSRMGDDNQSVIFVGFTPDADGFIDCVCKPDPNPSETGYATRFRTHTGGGTSPHTRNALLLLALAVVMDEKTHPQDFSKLDLGKM